MRFVLSLVIYFLLMQLSIPKVYAQMVSGNIFLKGNYVEIGQSEIGAFGSSVNALASYHPRVISGGSDNRLGFVSDPDQDGWSVGVPNYIGDYFLPGEPHEGFDIKVGINRNTAWNTGPGGGFNALTGTLLLTGANVSYSSEGSKRIAVWKGTMGNLSITQKTTLDITTTYFLVEVTLKNTGMTPLNDIYYNRTVDPDNEQTLTSDFTTANTIQYQPSSLSTDPDYRCLVTARGLLYPSKSYLGLGTYDCRAKAYIVNSGLAPTQPLQTIYAGSTPYFTGKGDTYTDDVGIGVVFNIGNLAPGDSTSLAYAYILKEADLDSAMSKIKPHWNVAGMVYHDRDTLEVCVGTVLPIEVVNKGNYTWGAWTPTAGLSSSSGPYNNITVGTTMRTYRIIGTSPNCMNDTLRITIKPSVPTVKTTLNDSICNGSVYNFNGTLLSVAGTYYDTISTAGLLCDSIVRLNLFVKPAGRDTVYAETCSLDSVLFYGTYYHEEGVYVYGEVVSGCEIEHVLIYSHTDTLITTVNILSCEGEDVLYGGAIYTSDTSLVDGYVSAAGCDSVRIVNINFMPTYMHEVNLTLCENELPYTFGSVVIPVGTVTTSNFDTLELSSMYGCDSFINMNVVIVDSNLILKDTVLCYGVSMNYQGGVIASAGVYPEFYTNAQNCDSTVVWYVDYTAAPVQVDSHYNGCNSLVYLGVEYVESTVLYDTIYNMLNCDSIQKRIFINIYRDSYDTLNVDICQGESFMFNGVEYSASILTTVTLENSVGCDSFVTLDIEVHPLPDIQLKYRTENDIICIHDTIYLQGTGGIIYRYYNQFGDQLDGDSSAWALVPLAQFDYQVVGADEWGCESEAFITVYAEACCEILIPNAFSPNGDGLNDTWSPVTYGNPIEYHLEIYDRFGNRVFSSYNVHYRWDGQYMDGKPAQSGTYFYVVSGKCFDGSSWVYRGDIVLVR